MPFTLGKSMVHAPAEVTVDSARSRTYLRLICRSLAFGCRGPHVKGTASAPVQHQQYRGKITNKTTTKSQRHTLHIPVKREAEIRFVVIRRKSPCSFRQDTHGEILEVYRHHIGW